jgi:hypothetical protein
MRMLVQDNIPYVWLSDGYHYIEALFTKEAINEFRKNYSHVKFNLLRDKIIFVSKWSLKVREIDSRKNYTSYQNIQVQMIIEHFKPVLHEKPSISQIAKTINLYKDEEMQTIIRHKRHEIIQELLAKHLYFTAEKNEKYQIPSLKDIFKSEEQYKKKEIPQQDDDIEMGDECNANNQDVTMFQDIMNYNENLMAELSTQISES